MSSQASLAASPLQQRPASPQTATATPAHRLSDSLPTIGLGLLAVSGWQIHEQRPYLPGSDFGYWLGVAGGSLMLALLLYPLRKRIRLLNVLGPLRHWFRFHLLAGILGPVLVLYHSTFHVGSVNAAVALASMLLVAASGIVGRFIYRRIHHGLFGSRATLGELQTALDEELGQLRPQLERLPAIQAELDRFRALVDHRPTGWATRLLHFSTLGLQRHLAVRRIRRQLRALGATGQALGRQIAPLLETSIHALSAVQKTAQFSTYERLFSLWHVVHVPFLCLLVITAIVHVIAVHAY